ncbi:MAG: hypothetical protein [Inoviridae sp.]|nr:MAG: hypothetical protein [Inoviridae sp.]
MRNGRQNFNNDYSQWDKNNTLAFALASMMFDRYTHVLVRRQIPGKGYEHIGGGSPVQLMKKYGDLLIESSIITRDGFLQITVK